MTEDTLWKLSDETIKLRREMKEEIEGLKEVLANGSLLALSSNDEIVKKYAELVGKIATLNVLQNSLTVSESNEE